MYSQPLSMALTLCTKMCLFRDTVVDLTGQPHICTELLALMVLACDEFQEMLNCLLPGLTLV